MTWLKVPDTGHECHVPMDGPVILGEVGAVWMCDGCGQLWRAYSESYPRRSIGWYAGWRRPSWREAGVLTRFRYRDQQRLHVEGTAQR